MTTHSECKHPPTKTARNGCRLLQKMITKAQALGLEVEQSHYNDWITSVIIRKPGELGTTLICTLGGSLRIKRTFLTKTENVPAKAALIWIGIIGRDWQKEN